jgi:N-acyl-D-aspartate/D-glutamate deacylase
MTEPTRPSTTLWSAFRVLGATVLAGALVACVASSQAGRGPGSYDVILRHGTLLDGSGNRRYVADVAIAGDRIARIGDLSSAHATIDLDVTGLLVAPGFINIHSHAVPAALPSAANMLTQGVTTEILNPDGHGPLDLTGQLTTLGDAGLALNVGAYIGFNSVWASVMGPAAKRPTSADVDSMRSLVVRGLAAGAFGVSAGLDYKPAYYATVDEVTSIVEPARRWRTNFTNHDRLAPESGYSSRAGMDETMRIGVQAGLVPVFTHMKVQGHEQGSAPQVLAWMQQNTADGRYVAADAYPYLAGQSGLVSLIVPGWAQDGGRDKMLERFKDPAQRARIIKESDEAIVARFGGPQGVYLNQSGRELADVMREMKLTSPGETVVRILETENPSAILRFGAEPDLVKLLQYPATSVACDCGAVPPGGRGHPRNYGSFPRVLGHYVRETKALTWESAIRKMTGLPASTVGLVDRGFLAPGMYADVVAFDSATVIDRATYDKPNELAEGIRLVLVNGKIALRDGTPTGERAGRALARTAHMPSRALAENVAHRVDAEGSIAAPEGALQLTLHLSQPAGAREPVGTLRLVDPRGRVSLDATTLGLLQVADGWASVTGRARVGTTGEERAVTVIVERADPLGGGVATVIVEVEGMPRVGGVLTPNSVSVSQGR